MRVIDRLVITLAALLVLFVGIVALALVAGWNATPMAIDAVVAARGSARMETGLLGLLAVGGALYLFAVAWQRDSTPGSIHQTGKLGDVYVSLRAVESLVLRATSSVKGVREVTTRLSQEAGELAIEVSLLITPERRVPEVTQEVQQRVEEYVREIVGIPVTKVAVEVRNIAPDPRPRVE